MKQLQSIIETAFEQRTELNPSETPSNIKSAVHEVIHHLDQGSLRIAEKINGEWQVHQWIKKAVLLYFKIESNQLFSIGDATYYDKVPLKYTPQNSDELIRSGVRLVPQSCVRKGAYLAANTIVMPSFVNIGAYVGSGTLIDTWATVGSCAQIGKNVHISGGVGIGGVLEPVQANPTIIEDDCFIGARSEIVEGVIVEKGSVIGMGVFLGQSTKIYDRETKTISYGRIPAGSVVVAGNLPSTDGQYSLYSAIIVKKVDEKTRQKTQVNELLRQACAAANN